MAYLAIRGSGAVNGVSRLHGEVSRADFQRLCSRAGRERSAGQLRHQRRARRHLGLIRADALWTAAGGKARWQWRARAGRRAIFGEFTLQPMLWTLRNVNRERFVACAAPAPGAPVDDIRRRRRSR